MSASDMALRVGSFRIVWTGVGAPLKRVGHNGAGVETTGGDRMVRLTRYAGVVYWLAWYLTEDDESAEEVLQQTFQKADSAGSEPGESALLLLARIAIRECFVKLQIQDASELSSFELDGEMDGISLPSEVAAWSDDVERYPREKLRGLVHQGIMRLAPFSRIVFLLIDMAHLNPTDVAELFHIPIWRIKSRSHRSRMELREHLNAHFKLSAKEASLGRDPQDR